MITAHSIPSSGYAPSALPADFPERRALGRLIAAAVISSSFCRLLLKDPARAIRQGYNGESFRLSQPAEEFVLSIQAESLPEFARALDAADLSTPIPTGGLSSGKYTKANALFAEKVTFS
jgi:hypothetical protein